MNAVSPSHPSGNPLQVAQADNVNQFIDSQTGKSSMVPIAKQLREIPGRVENSMRGLAENAVRYAVNLGQELLNKGLRLLQGGQQ